MVSSPGAIHAPSVNSAHAITTAAPAMNQRRGGISPRYMWACATGGTSPATSVRRIADSFDSWASSWINCAEREPRNLSDGMTRVSGVPSA